MCLQYISPSSALRKGVKPAVCCNISVCCCVRVWIYSVVRNGISECNCLFCSCGIYEGKAVSSHTRYSVFGHSNIYYLLPFCGFLLPLLIFHYLASSQPPPPTLSVPRPLTPSCVCAHLTLSPPSPDVCECEQFELFCEWNLALNTVIMVIIVT